MRQMQKCCIQSGESSVTRGLRSVTIVNSVLITQSAKKSAVLSASLRFLFDLYDLALTSGSERDT